MPDPDYVDQIVDRITEEFKSRTGRNLTLAEIIFAMDYIEQGLEEYERAHPK
jgi:hypothetical protein